MVPVGLYAFFHFNLAYSSLDKAQRPTVIQSCYWPLLRLIEETATPFGIELSGFTLELINQLDPAWVKEFRRLLRNQRCELIGSGDTQLIGPLAPPEVNQANLALGQMTYDRLLDIRPTIALINEQAYSADLIDHYKTVGYQAVIMEWDNPASWQANWDREWRFLPQRVKGVGEIFLPLIWNQAIAFQKFQRYIHGELPELDYWLFLTEQLSDKPRLMPLYGNDAEIFGFRPGRFPTEAPLQKNEWGVMKDLLLRIGQDERFFWLRPSEILGYSDAPGANQILSLESACHPVPVKKQRKYNLCRWAVSGRDDLRLNTRCHALTNTLSRQSPWPQSMEKWRQICRLWSSDLRTHITDRRWQEITEYGNVLQQEWRSSIADSIHILDTAETRSSELPEGVELKRDHQSQRIEIKTSHLRIVLNTRRGLTVDRLAFAEHNWLPLVGTLDHGYFHSIELGADFYTGGVVIEVPASHQRITDLELVQPDISYTADEIILRAVIITALGEIHKQIRVSMVENKVHYQVNFPEWERPQGTLRVGHVTLLPDAFVGPLSYEVCNGGWQRQRYYLDRDCLQDQPVSSLVSASTGLGATDGRITIGDDRHRLDLAWIPEKCAAFPMIHHRVSAPGALTRVIYSLSELDDTWRTGGGLLPFKLTLTPNKERVT